MPLKKKQPITRFKLYYYGVLVIETTFKKQKKYQFLNKIFNSSFWNTIDYK